MSEGVPPSTTQEGYVVDADAISTSFAISNDTPPPSPEVNHEPRREYNARQRSKFTLFWCFVLSKMFVGKLCQVAY